MFLFQIALAAIFLIDNGITGSMRSGRARKEYQGKGILRKLNTELIKHHPTVKYASLVTASNLTELYSKINSGSLRLITIQVITM